MESILCIPLGIVVERRRAAGHGPSHLWRTSGVLIGPARLPPGSPLWREGETGYYFAGGGTLTLYPAEVAAYRENLTRPVPRLFVVLTAQEREQAPPHVHMLTAAPEAARAYAAAGKPILVDGLAMSKQLRDLVAAYIDEYAPSQPWTHGDRAPPLDRSESRR
jgi:Protein of unknown function (DUF3305)